MAKQTSAFKPTGYRLESAKFTSADTTTGKSVGAAGANDSAIKGIIISSDDTSARNMQLIAYDGATSYVLDTKAVPAGSGTDGTNAAVDGLGGSYLPLDGTGKKFIPLEAGWSLYAAMLATITAAKTVTITLVIEDY